ncbi:hypothetical protein GW17_00052327 [Ensete ventricosum]|nr:hypothetical protein GW17_00052327 [Ensete ventricosum]
MVVEAGLSPAPRAIGSTVEKRTSVDVGSSLRKHNRRGTSEQLANALGSTTRVPIEKGKEPVETEEAPERGYTLRKLDRAGAETYFVTIMMRLKAVEGEDPLVSRWSAISGSSQIWTKGPLFGEYLRGAMHSVLTKQIYEYYYERFSLQNNNGIRNKLRITVPQFLFKRLCILKSVSPALTSYGISSTTNGIESKNTDACRLFTINR